MIKSFTQAQGNQDAITGLTAHGNKLYFSALDGANGFELWTSDGTASGTQPLKTINPTGDSNPSHFKSFNGKIYFQAEDENGKGLWISDGTSSGTQKIKSIQPHIYINTDHGLNTTENYTLLQMTV